MSFEVSLDNFSGPLAKLLELIEEKKYEITQVSLANVTGDFLEYLNIVDRVDSRLLADFVAIAARLILIKSKHLVPEMELTEEEEGDIKELEERLKLYKEFKDAIESIRTLWGKHAIAYPREVKTAPAVPIFSISELITKDTLDQSIAKLWKVIDEVEKRYEEYDALNIEEYIEKLSATLGGRMASFSSITHKREKKEVIILFLALLHLLKESKIDVEQEEQFSEILIKPNHA